MKIHSTRRLCGPNVYVDRPAMVARVHLERLTMRETREYPGLAGRLLTILPGLTEHHCAAGRPGGFVARLHGGTYFGHVAEHVALELSALIDRPVHFGRTEYAGAPGHYDVVTECAVDEPPTSQIAEDLLALAVDVVLETVDGGVPEITRRLRPIADRWERLRPGPSTAAIAAAARARDIPVERIGELNLLSLGYGRYRRLVWAAMTDATSAIGVDIAGDKELARRLLADAAVPVPEGGVAATAAQAVAIFAGLGPPVVVKPRRGRQGQHVYLGLNTPEAVRAAFAAITGDVGSGDAGPDTSAGDAGEVVVERQLDGRDYRVLTVRGEVIAAAERIPAHVIGDGVADVATLVRDANSDPRRGAGHGRALTHLPLDGAAIAVLDQQRLGVDAVPEPGRVVWLRHNANLSTGGTSRDVTDRVHPDVADLCRRTAELVGLDIAGIDLRLPDIAAPLRPSGGSGARVGAGGVIEVNAAPGLRMHFQSSSDGFRTAADAIVDSLYPAGADKRVPTVAVAGTNGKTTTARLIAHLLAHVGRRVGMTSSDGVYVGGRLVQRADATGPRSAHVVLGDPTVAVAVLETARGGLLRQGLGYDWTDVGVVTNVAADHLGQDGIDTVDDLVHVKALVAERVRDGGTLVLNADDARVRGLIERQRVRAGHKRLLWFGLDSESALLARHVDNGGFAYVLSGGVLVELAGRGETPLIALDELPGAFGGAATFAAANALAAAAAARALGVPVDSVAEGLATFDPAHENPGRGQLFEYRGVHLLVDYAHNPAAIAAMGVLLDRVWGREHAIAAVTLPGDRRDDLLADCARVVADFFTRAVLYEDVDRRGRAPGEVPALVRAEIAARRPSVRVTVVDRVEEAVPAALAMASPGDVVLLLYEEIDPVLAVLDRLAARQLTNPGELARLRILGAVGAHA